MHAPPVRARQRHRRATRRRHTRRGGAAVAVAVGLVCVLAGCQPATREFPMPDEFPLPIEPSNTVSALSCPDAAAHAADVPADSDNWQRLYDNALLASAARTLVANPDIAAFGTDADVATGNPWLLPPDVFARISDPDYWAALCDTGTGTDNGQAYAEFVALRQQELTIRFTADLEAMVEPSRASLQSDS